MAWSTPGLDESDVIFSAGTALAIFLVTRRTLARESFGRAQFGRLLLAVSGILIGFVLLGLALDTIFGTARRPLALPRIVLDIAAQVLGILAVRFVFPPRPVKEPTQSRIHVRQRRDS